MQTSSLLSPNPRLALAGRRLPLPIRQAVDLVVREKRVSKALILNGSRCRMETARARQLSMYLAHVVFGQTLTAIGEAFGRDRTTVSYACAVIEDLRDDRGFDAEVTRLETLLQQAGEDDDGRAH